MWAVGRPLGPRRVLHFEWKLRPQPLHVRRTPPELTPTCPPHAQPHVMPAAAYRVSSRSDSTLLNVAFAAVSWWPFGRKSRSASSARDAWSEPPSTTAAAAAMLSNESPCERVPPRCGGSRGRSGFGAARGLLPPPPPSLPSPTGRARFLDFDAARGGGAGAVKSCGNAKSASTSAREGTGGKPHETRCFTAKSAAASASGSLSYVAAETTARTASSRIENARSSSLVPVEE